MYKPSSHYREYHKVVPVGQYCIGDGGEKKTHKKAEHIVETYSIFHCLWPDVLVLIASGSLSKSLM